MASYEAHCELLDLSIEDPISGCILFQGDLDEQGYGTMVADGLRWRAHRLAWACEFGWVPRHKVIDHVCHNEAAHRGECKGGRTCVHRRCVNTKHMRLTTVAENLAASPLTHSGRARMRART